MKIIFYISLLLIFYVYFGYPILLVIFSRFRPKPVHKEFWEPTVSIIISAYNEELSLREKIENTLALDYPKEKKEIIIASDASTDRTDDIVKSFQSEGVVLIRKEPRRGKTASQNKAVNHAKGEIIVFSDATTHYAGNALRKIVENFADPEVGCVGGLLEYVDTENNIVGSGGGLYWKYETWLKKMESATGSLIGVSGCLYAVRKSIYRPLPEDLISDFLIALETARMGYRTVLEPDAIAKEKIEDRTGSEFQMRVRVIVRTLRAILKSTWALNIFKNTRLAWQLWSHKVLRYSVPYFLVLLLLSSLFLGSPINWIFISFQMIFYGMAGFGYYIRRRDAENRFLNIPFYFCLANLSSFIAFLKMVKGEKYVVWETIRG
ncbi:MAG: glycosyltransferase [Candidatus Dadabacteria bacterium]|nr:glycosyltransferase [Candidatus Dadabacteria bacterium]